MPHSAPSGQSHVAAAPTQPFFATWFVNSQQRVNLQLSICSRIINRHKLITQQSATAEWQTSNYKQPNLILLITIRSMINKSADLSVVFERILRQRDIVYSHWQYVWQRRAGQNNSAIHEAPKLMIASYMFDDASICNSACCRIINRHKQITQQSAK